MYTTPWHIDLWRQSSEQATRFAVRIGPSNLSRRSLVSKPCTAQNDGLGVGVGVAMTEDAEEGVDAGRSQSRSE